MNAPPPDVRSAPQPAAQVGAATLVPGPKARLAAVLGVPAFLIRLVYFAVVPFLLVVLAAYLPLTGALVNLGLMVGYFLVSPWVKHHIERRPRLAKVLVKLTRFEAYYRESPPRLFVYYVFYPLLFPYWLFVAKGRREFLLYRGFGVVALVVIFGGGALEYFGRWYPEIKLGPFLGIFILCFIAQVFVTLAFMVPIATTTVTYQLGKMRRRLVALYVVGALSAALAIAVMVKRRHDLVPFTTHARIVLRGKANPERAAAVFDAALEATRETRGKSETFKDVEGGREIQGPRLDAARAELAKYWREDEARAFVFALVFDLEEKPVFALYYLDAKGKPVFLSGFDAKGETLRAHALVERIGPRGLSVLAKMAKK